MASSPVYSPERRAIVAGLSLTMLLVSSMAIARVPPPESIYLGTRTLTCGKALRIFGKKSVFYPTGKSEWLTVTVPSDLIVYDCGYRRARLICAIHTTEIKLRRSSSRGTFEVKCYGPPRHVRGATAETVEEGRSPDDATPMPAATE